MKKIINDYANYTVPFYGPADFVVKKAKGSYVWDINNKKYIDFTAGIAVTNLGHSNSELTKILNQQSKNVWHLSNLYIVLELATQGKMETTWIQISMVYY